MASQDHIWEERISNNLFLTHHLVSKGNTDERKEMETERKWSFQEKKNYKRKTCFTKCSLWKIFQLNVKIKKNE